MRTSDERAVKHRLQKRRWAIMARYRIWDDGWVHDLSDEDARQLLSIFEAIRRLDLGTWGICVECGSAIDYERLSALPEAGVCVVCAQFAPAHAACH
jgi:RNA polymerase-binding transcription factor DksA